MKKKFWFLTISFMSFFSFIVSADIAFADEIGGVVQTKGEVGFYEETTSSSTFSSDSKVPNKPTKPKGKLPSTGELIKKSILISGSLILLLVLFVLVNKRRKKE